MAPVPMMNYYTLQIKKVTYLKNDTTNVIIYLFGEKLTLINYILDKRTASVPNFLLHRLVPVAWQHCVMIEWQKFTCLSRTEEKPPDCRIRHLELDFDISHLPNVVKHRLIE